MIFEHPQMWVWPQVPLERPSPSSLGRTLPEHCIKSQGGWGEERGGRWGGKGCGQGRVLQLQWRGWGRTLQTAAGARPTSGGSRDLPKGPGRNKILPLGAPGLHALLNYFGINFCFDYTYTYTFHCFGN